MLTATLRRNFGPPVPKQNQLRAVLNILFFVSCQIGKWSEKCSERVKKQSMFQRKMADFKAK